jgi:uncharacterized protein YbcI
MEHDEASEHVVVDEREVGELTRLTRAMVGIYKEQFGRGPHHAHSHYCGSNAVTCFLEGTLTPLERALSEQGEHQRIRDIRTFFQYSSEAAFRSAAEGATGRTVTSFISGIDAAMDVSIETFVLEPIAG